MKWSSIGRLGNTKLSRISVFVPFFAYLLFFAEEFNGAFNFATPLVIDGEGNLIGLVNWLYSHQIALQFLGLTLFAAGSASYLILSPRHVRLFPDVSDLIAYIQGTGSSTLINEFQRSSLGAYRRRFRKTYDGRNLKELERPSYRFSYPGRAIASVEFLRSKVIKRQNPGLFSSEPNSLEKRQRCIQIILFHAPPELNLKISGHDCWIKIHDDLAKEVNDIVYSYYLYRDFSRFPARIFTAALFVIALLVLLIPPILTLIRLFVYEPI
ncbi:hypothetical protein [Palleronia sp. LCG004]|uniref:hypothetical protein n=1 Tax=Palleronia sp. LCG004 TaxID=3079304 RepID=UPI002942BE45|nr:hypothetical protein [Palleronia sp. LCG004]WOI56958.1 hypothetical protein RVY76_03940 [Palleronia sp. LCG004]